MIWGILFGIIVAACIVKICTKNPQKSKRAKSDTDPTKDMNETIAQPPSQVDSEIMERIAFFTSVAVKLARSSNPNLPNQAPYHGLIRILTGDCQAQSYVEFYAATFNIYQGLEEFHALLRDKTTEHAEQFLRTVGFREVSVCDFFRYVSEAKCELGPYGSISVKYTPNIPKGMGRSYYDEIRCFLSQQWSELAPEYHKSYIDVSL